MNSFTFIGRLTADIELRYTNTQMAVAKFSIAIDRGKDSDGKDKGADFPRITVFGKQAENCERFLKKGSQVAVSGKVQTGSYKDDKGETVYTTDFLASQVEFLGSKPQGEKNSVKSEIGSSQAVASGGFAVLDEDIPFS